MYITEDTILFLNHRLSSGNIAISKIATLHLCYVIPSRRAENRVRHLSLRPTEKSGNRSDRQ